MSEFQYGTAHTVLQDTGIGPDGSDRADDDPMFDDDGYTAMTPAFDEDEMLEALEEPDEEDAQAELPPQEAYETMKFMAPMSETEAYILDRTPFMTADPNASEFSSEAPGHPVEWIDDPDHNEWLLQRAGEGHKGMDEVLEDEMYGDEIGFKIKIKKPKILSKVTKSLAKVAAKSVTVPLKATGTVLKKTAKVAMTPLALATKFIPGRDAAKAKLVKSLNSKLVKEHMSFLRVKDLKRGIRKPASAYLNVSKQWSKNKLAQGGLPTSFTSGNEVSMSILGSDVCGFWINPLSWFQSKTKYVLVNTEGERMREMSEAEYQAYAGTKEAMRTGQPQAQAQEQETQEEAAPAEEEAPVEEAVEETTTEETEPTPEESDAMGAFVGKLYKSIHDPLENVEGDREFHLNGDGEIVDGADMGAFRPSFRAARRALRAQRRATGTQSYPGAPSAYGPRYGAYSQYGTPYADPYVSPAYFQPGQYAPGADPNDPLADVDGDRKFHLDGKGNIIDGEELDEMTEIVGLDDEITEIIGRGGRGGGGGRRQARRMRRQQRRQGQQGQPGQYGQQQYGQQQYGSQSYPQAYGPQAQQYQDYQPGGMPYPQPTIDVFQGEDTESGKWWNPFSWGKGNAAAEMPQAQPEPEAPHKLRDAVRKNKLRRRALERKIREDAPMPMTEDMNRQGEQMERLLRANRRSDNPVSAASIIEAMKMPSSYSPVEGAFVGDSPTEILGDDDYSFIVGDESEGAFEEKMIEASGDADIGFNRNWMRKARRFGRGQGRQHANPAQKMAREAAAMPFKEMIKAQLPSGQVSKSLVDKWATARSGEAPGGRRFLRQYNKMAQTLRGRNVTISAEKSETSGRFAF